MGLALSSEMALCLHAVQFHLLPQAGLDKSFVHGEDTSGDNLQHFNGGSSPCRVPCRTSLLLIKEQMFWKAGNGFSLLFQSCASRGTPAPLQCRPVLASVGLVVVGVLCRVLFYFVTLFTFRIVPGMGAMKPILNSINRCSLI